ncbi:MAG: VOC family protein [Egibacteraceae bacterium]
MTAVSLVTLGVADLSRASAFYERLGWRRSSSSVDGVVAFFHGGTAALGLFGWDDLAEDAHLPADRPEGFRGISLAMNVASERAVDDALRLAEEAGGTISKPGERAEWGGYSGYFRDPDDHLWEVAHNPGWALRPDGGVSLPD